MHFKKVPSERDPRKWVPESVIIKRIIFWIFLDENDPSESYTNRNIGKRRGTFFGTMTHGDLSIDYEFGMIGDTGKLLPRPPALLAEEYFAASKRVTEGKWLTDSQKHTLRLYYTFAPIWGIAQFKKHPTENKLMMSHFYCDFVLDIPDSEYRLLDTNLEIQIFKKSIGMLEFGFIETLHHSKIPKLRIYDKWMPFMGFYDVKKNIYFNIIFPPYILPDELKDK